MNDRGDGRLLLDTHTWIWASESNERMLTRRSTRLIEGVAQRGGLLIAAISLWEISLLESKGRVRLGIPIAHWFERALKAPGLSVVQLTPGICMDAASIPLSDPSDRLIAASARAAYASLVTRDARLIDYGRNGSLNVIDASR